MQTKDILQLKQKATITGTEKLPVSKDEYVTLDQITKKVESEVTRLEESCIKKTDRLIVGGCSPAELKNF